MPSSPIGLGFPSTSTFCNMKLTKTVTNLLADWKITQK